MRGGLTGLFILAGICAAAAQDHSAAVGEHGPANLNQVQTEGRRLYLQSCGVCHTRPTITAPLFGPQLTSAAVDGAREAQARKQIAMGSPNMPGFQYNYTPAQIDAVVEFIKLLPAPKPAPPSAPASPQR